MPANPAHSHPTRKLSRQVGTLSSALTASILRESSWQHRYTLFSIRIPYSKTRPGTYTHASTKIPFRELYRRYPHTFNSNPLWKPCRDNSQYPFALYREL